MFTKEEFLIPTEASIPYELRHCNERKTCGDLEAFATFEMIKNIRLSISNISGCLICCSNFKLSGHEHNTIKTNKHLDLNDKYRHAAVSRERECIQTHLLLNDVTNFVSHLCT